MRTASWPGLKTFALASAVARLTTPHRLWRYPSTLFLVTVALYAVTVFRSNGPIEPTGKILGRDFFAFYTGGQLVQQGRLSDLYNPVAHAEYQRQFMDRINPLWEGTYPYRNPPHYAWAMSWLARLDYLPALAVWSLLSLVCFGVTAWVWRSWLALDTPRPPSADRLLRNRRAKPDAACQGRAPGRAGLVILLAVCMPTWFQALAGGQNTFISLLILTGFCALLMKGHDGRAGLVLSLLSYKFYLILLPASLLLVKRRWRALGGILLGGTLTLALTALVMGPDVIADYISFAPGQAKLMEEDGFDVHKQHCWYGLFRLAGAGWMPLPSIQILTVTACLGTVVLLLPVWRGSWNHAGDKFPVKLAALMMATLVTSPHLLHYDVTLAVLPVILWRAGRTLTWRRDVKGRDRAAGPALDAALRTILVVGFCWLTVAEPLARHVPLQLSPLLMLWFLTRACAIPIPSGPARTVGRHA